MNAAASRVWGVVKRVLILAHSRASAFTIWRTQKMSWRSALGKIAKCYTLALEKKQVDWRQ